MKKVCSSEKFTVHVLASLASNAHCSLPFAVPDRATAPLISLLTAIKLCVDLNVN